MKLIFLFLLPLAGGGGGGRGGRNWPNTTTSVPGLVVAIGALLVASDATGASWSRPAASGGEVFGEDDAGE
eukprot:SAG11_NODE_26709_length_341_cov_6.904959_1_plen_70_part_10